MSGEPNEIRLAAKSPKNPPVFAPHCVTNTRTLLAELPSGLNPAEGSPASLHGSQFHSLVVVMICPLHQTTQPAAAPAPAVAGPVNRQFPRCAVT